MGKEHRKQPRIRTTNKALEGRQFSTVRLPKKNEVKQASTLPLDMRSGPQAQQQIEQQQRQKLATQQEKQQEKGHFIDSEAGQGDFDPIVNDGTFLVVDPEDSCWPPPKLADLISGNVAADESFVSKDALDMYDRSNNSKYNSFNQGSLNAAKAIVAEHSSKVESGSGDGLGRGFFGHSSLLTNVAASNSGPQHSSRGNQGGNHGRHTSAPPQRQHQQQQRTAHDHRAYWNQGQQQQQRPTDEQQAPKAPATTTMQRSTAGKLKAVDGPLVKTQRVKGEINLPSGKARTNSKMTFDGSDSD